MTPRPITRYLLRLVCHACSRGFYAAVPLILPPTCPACAGGLLRPGGMWDLAREARPAWGVLSHAEVQP